MECMWVCRRRREEKGGKEEEKEEGAFCRKCGGPKWK